MLIPAVAPSFIMLGPGSREFDARPADDERNIASGVPK